MANIKDVARLAGVSVSTVSNILNNKISVSEELHQRVVAAMRELDYRPSFLAMNLRRRQMSFVGVVVSSLDGHYHQIVDGIYRVAKELKCQPIVKVVTSAMEEHREIEALAQLSVAGLIVVSSHLNEKLLSHYKETNLPTVFADTYPTDADVNVVRFDNKRITSELTGRLLTDGKRVGLVIGPRHLGSERDCLDGYTAALGEGERCVFETEFNKERAFSGLIRFICSERELPDAFIVSAPHLGRTLSEILGLLGMHHISVYALSGDSWYKYGDEATTYVRREAIDCGMQAMRLLHENIEKPVIFDKRQITVKTYGEVEKLFDREGDLLGGRDEGKTLRLLLLKSNISSATRMLSRDFTAKTGIKVSVTAASQQELSRIVAENAESHSPEYDVIMADMHWLPQLRKEQVFARLNGLLPVGEILPRYVRDVRNFILAEAEGEDIFALPILVGYQMLAYRSDLFEDALLKKQFYLKYGVDLRPPETWSEFNLVARFFTREFNPDSPTKYGTCLAGGRPDGIMAEFLPRQWSYRGHFLGEGGLEIESAANLKAMKSLLESYRYSYPDCADYLEDEQVQEFIGGDVAMISTYNVHLQDRLDFKEQNVRFSRLPGTSALIGGWLLGINAYSRNIEESARFLLWEMSDRISVHSSLLGQVSPFKTVFHDNELLSIYPWMSITGEYSETLRGKEFGTLSIRNQRGGRALETGFSERIWEVLHGRMTPEEALSSMQEQFKDMHPLD